MAQIEKRHTQFRVSPIRNEECGPNALSPSQVTPKAVYG